MLINDFSVGFLSALASFGIGNEAETSGLPDQSTLEFVNCGYYAGDLGEGAAGLNGTTYTSVFSSCYPYVPSNGGIVLILDTLGPQNVAVIINEGVSITSSFLVDLAISTSDEDTTGYQMKVWGDIAEIQTEDEAAWQTYASSIQLALAAGDGVKKVYVKLRDDVLNESATVNATIEVNTTAPVITILSGPDISRVSYNAPKDVVNFSWRADIDVVEWKVCVVASETDAQNVGTVIPVTNGSENMQGTELVGNTAVARY